MIELNAFLCKGCGYCIKFCPRNVLVMGTERNKRGFFYPQCDSEKKCSSCAICAAVCPEGAIELSGEEK